MPYRYDRNERRTVKCLAIMFVPFVAMLMLAWSFS